MTVDVIAELNQRLTMVRGDNAAWQGIAVDPTNGLAKNITGCTITFYAKRSSTDDDSAALITKTVGNGITILNAANGIFQVGPLASADTTQLADALTGLVFAVRLVDGAGVKTTISAGTMIVRP